jgi:hypothetical protein
MDEQKESPKATPMKTKEKTDSTETQPLEYAFTAVKKKPTRKYRKGSKYDPVLDAFVAHDGKLVEVTLEGKDANYIRTQLNKRITDEPKFKGISVSVVNNVAYLEKE